MTENKRSFVLYADLIHTVKKLPADKAGELFLHILSYVNDENPTIDDLLIEITFEPIKQQLKRDLDKYEKTKAKRAEAGRRGGIKSGETRGKQSETLEANTTLNEANEANASFVKQNEANEAVNVNDSVNVNDNVNVILLEKETKEGEKQVFPSSQNQEENQSHDSDAKQPTAELSKKVAQKKVFTKAKFKEKLLELQVEEKDADEWIEVRRQKRAVFTDSAIENILDECKKFNLPFPEAIKASAKFGWQGFKYEWYQNRKQEENGISNSNTTTRNNNFGSNTAGNNQRVQSGKMSYRSMVANRLAQQSQPNSPSEGIIIEAEVVE